MLNPEENRTSQANPVATLSQLRQTLHALHRGGGLSEQELLCFGQFSELFNPTGNPLTKPLGREAFETCLRYMSNLEDELVEPFVEKLLRAGLLIKTQIPSDAISIPGVVLEHARNIIAEMGFEA